MGKINMKAAVCDDEKAFHKELSSLVRKYMNVRGAEIYTDFYVNGEELLKSKKEYDIIFLDYQMEGINGIETAEKLREVNTDSVIIFISAYPAAALDAYEVKTFRFLAKPVDEAKLFKALDDYVKSIDYDNLLLLNTHEGNYKIKTSEIIYLEGDGKYTIIRTKNKSFRIHINLKQLELKLPETKFVRCSKSYVVGFAHISNHNNSEILFDNGEKAKIGAHYVANFKTEFQNYIIRYNEVHSI
ncbi:MAG: LytTR family DNA-binding domain-containing protein [Eubacterium sp.]|nr:LytTR family DNA-binding domain-containing protein [Eubacterium sp.]